MNKFVSLLIGLALMVAATSSAAETIKSRLVIDIGPLGVHSWIIK